MNVVATEACRTLVVFAGEEIRPNRGYYLPNLVHAITERYSFAFSPDLSKPWEEVDRTGLIFRSGRVTFGHSEININEMGVYKDAVYVTALSTEDADSVIDELFSWAGSAFGLREFQTAPKRYYASQLVVEFEKSLSRVFRDFEQIAKILSSLYIETYDIRDGADVARITFGLDRGKTFPPFITDIEIERRVQRAFSEERYYCAGPFQTSHLIRALESLEASLP